MKNVFTMITLVAILSVSGLAAADCPADIDGSGDVGFSDLTAVLGAWGPCPGCAPDIDGSGDVGFSDLTSVLGAWGPCPGGYECRDDMPEYYDPAPGAHHERSIEWAANGTCAEMIAESGSTAPTCTQDETAEMLTDINWILANYDFTGAVFDAQSGALQTYRRPPSTLLCGSGEGIFPEGFFDDIYQCWHGDLRPDSSFVLDFDWNVNVYEAFDDYEAYVQATYPGGFCELDVLVGQVTGFHAEDQGDGWKYWTVRSTETCDFYGCRCDATVTLWSNGTDYFIDQVTNNSTFTMYQGSRCEDPRFSF